MAAHPAARGLLGAEHACRVDSDAGGTSCGRRDSHAYQYTDRDPSAADSDSDQYPVRNCDRDRAYRDCHTDDDGHPLGNFYSDQRAGGSHA